MKKFFLIYLMFFLSQNSFSQYKRYFNRELKNYENYVFAKEQDVGRLLNWRDFRKRHITTWNGKGESTMLLGSATYLYDYLKDKYPDFEAKVIKRKSQWHIRFNFNETSIDLFKRLQLKRQWQDQFAYQRPENYWVAYGFDNKDNRLNEAISVLKYYYEESNIEFQSDIETKKLKQELVKSPRNGNDYASIYFYNLPSFYNDNTNIKYELKLNDSTIYEFQRDVPAIVNIYKEGDFTISAKTGELTELKMNLEFGKDYFIRCGIYLPSVLRKPKLQLVIEDFARDEYEACVDRKAK